MGAKLIDGKAIAQQIKEEARIEALALEQAGVTACLAVVLVGDNAASKVYVNNKKKACQYCSIKSLSYELPANTTQQELLDLIDVLNHDRNVHGILVQLPLPAHIKEKDIILSISPKKDVDCFHPQNVGALQTGMTGFLPCTPAGIIELLKRSGCEISGKSCVMIGRSNIVGKPAALLLLAQNGTVTICHSKTKDLNAICKRADIIIVATGKRNTLTADMVNENAVIIDVGMNRDENGTLCGDVDFDAVAPIVRAITPVPGGVGPMTIAMLMKNCIAAAQMSHETEKQR